MLTLEDKVTMRYNIFIYQKSRLASVMGVACSAVKGR